MVRFHGEMNAAAELDCIVYFKEACMCADLQGVWHKKVEQFHCPVRRKKSVSLWRKSVEKTHSTVNYCEEVLETSIVKLPVLVRLLCEQAFPPVSRAAELLSLAVQIWGGLFWEEGVWLCRGAPGFLCSPAARAGLGRAGPSQTVWAGMCFRPSRTGELILQTDTHRDQHRHTQRHGAIVCAHVVQWAGSPQH